MESSSIGNKNGAKHKIMHGIEDYQINKRREIFEITDHTQKKYVFQNRTKIHQHEQDDIEKV